MNETEWKDYVKGMVKAEIKRRNMTVKQVCEILNQPEYNEPLNEDAFNNKLSRGGFSAVFFMKVMKALGVRDVRVD